MKKTHFKRCEGEGREGRKEGGGGGKKRDDGNKGKRVIFIFIHFSKRLMEENFTIKGNMLLNFHDLSVSMYNSFPFL